VRRKEGRIGLDRKADKGENGTWGVVGLESSSGIGLVEAVVAMVLRNG